MSDGHQMPAITYASTQWSHYTILRTFVWNLNGSLNKTNMRTNIALRVGLGNHLDIDSLLQKIKGMFFIAKDNEKCINLHLTKFSAFLSSQLPEAPLNA